MQLKKELGSKRGVEKYFSGALTEPGEMMI